MMAALSSRSGEVKKLGIKMAVPLHQVEHLIKKYNIQLFSSNYALYADLSTRVMSVLEEFTPHLEIYSIDEAFLDLTGIAEQNPIAYGQQIKKSIWRNTGLPVCVGIGPTKTLAKLANFAAKKWQKTEGVVDLTCPSRRNKLMCQVPVNEVWGIGSQTAKKLNQLGINKRMGSIPPASSFDTLTIQCRYCPNRIGTKWLLLPFARRNRTG